MEPETDVYAFDGPQPGPPLPPWCPSCNVPFTEHMGLVEMCRDMSKTKDSLLKVQKIAKSSLDKLTSRWNDGFQAGLKQAVPYEKELVEALAAEKKARLSDNADLTEQIMAAEARIEELEHLSASLIKRIEGAEKIVS